MSSSSTNMSLGAIGTDAGIQNLNLASIPQDIRDGDNKAKEAYSEGLGFESMLVNELTQQLANTMYGGQGSGSGDDSSDGGDGSSDGASSSGMLGGASAYASLIPQALGSSIMSNGGLGMAAQFAEELDPSLQDQSAGAAAQSGSTTDAATGATEATTGATDAASGATDSAETAALQAVQAKAVS